MSSGRRKNDTVKEYYAGQGDDAIGKWLEVVDNGKLDVDRGIACSRNGQYEEAERLLRRGLQGYERTLGEEHDITFDAKHWLACTLYEQERYPEAEELFQENVHGQEKVQGNKHETIRPSIYWLGLTFCVWEEYKRAEGVLRWAVQLSEDVLGREHEDTIQRTHFLARTLFDQDKYHEAVELLRHVVQLQEKVLGLEDHRTQVSIWWLARSLHETENYQEAEEFFRLVHRQQAKLFGEEHTTTLKTKHQLALTLFKQKKYRQAEELWRQALNAQERFLGDNDKDTASSQFWLAYALYEQGAYPEAEEQMRSLLQTREQAFGKQNADTLDSQWWVATILYKQRKYEEAKNLFEEKARAEEAFTGAEHKRRALEDRQSVAEALHRLKRYEEAESVIERVVQGRQELLGLQHENTIESGNLLREIRQRLAEVSTSLDTEFEAGQNETCGKNEGTMQNGKASRNSSTTIPAKGKLTIREAGLSNAQASTAAKDAPSTLSRDPLDPDTSILLPFLEEHTVQSNIGALQAFFPETSERQPFTDMAIYEISSLLKISNLRWSKVPRTYIVLRVIGALNLLDELIDLGFSDHFFPVTEKGIPAILRPGQRKEFIDAQELVLTKSMDLERGQEGQHCRFKRDEPFPFRRTAILGTGAFGQVDKVLSLNSGKEYARKVVPRGQVFAGRATTNIKRFIAEIQILKRLRHHHVVEFIGSYTDPKYVGLLMFPVAQMDLTCYLASIAPSQHKELRTFFGCLAKALEFLHSQNIRHKDVKPSNILVDHGNVLFTDFGLSLDFTDANGSTTVSMVNGMTPRYCAPEVANYEPRNTSSDIWSLGIVFLEMVVALKERRKEYIDEFFQAHGTRETFVRTNLTALSELIIELRGMAAQVDDVVLGWIEGMLQIQRDARPTATALVASITYGNGKIEESNGRFCGICCLTDGYESFDDDDEDELFAVANDLRGLTVIEERFRLPQVEI